jgi:hypothetical protein
LRFLPASAFPLWHLDRGAALAALKALKPVPFAYKENPGDTNVGYMPRAYRTWCPLRTARASRRL